METADRRRISREMRKIRPNILLNDYVAEEVIFGRMKPGEKIDVEACLKSIGLNSSLNRFDSAGNVIDEEGRVREKDIAEYRKYYFNFWFSSILLSPSALIGEYYDDDGMLICSEEMGKYVQGAFSLFEKVIDTEIGYNESDLMLECSESIRQESYKLLERLLAHLIKNKLNVSKNIRNIVDAVGYMPYCVKRIISEKKVTCCIECEPESDDFKLAAFSLFRFINVKNVRLLELKSRQWIKLNEEK